MGKGDTAAIADVTVETKNETEKPKSAKQPPEKTGGSKEQPGIGGTIGGAIGTMRQKLGQSEKVGNEQKDKEKVKNRIFPSSKNKYRRMENRPTKTIPKKSHVIQLRNRVAVKSKLVLAALLEAPLEPCAKN